MKLQLLIVGLLCLSTGFYFGKSLRRARPVCAVSVEDASPVSDQSGAPPVAADGEDVALLRQALALCQKAPPSTNLPSPNPTGFSQQMHEALAEPGAPPSDPEGPSEVATGVDAFEKAMQRLQPRASDETNGEEIEARMPASGDEP